LSHIAEEGAASCCITVRKGAISAC
jgi:hypothetical protein